MPSLCWCHLSDLNRILEFHFLKWPSPALQTLVRTQPKGCLQRSLPRAIPPDPSHRCFPIHPSGRWTAAGTCDGYGMLWPSAVALKIDQPWLSAGWLRVAITHHWGPWKSPICWQKTIENPLLEMDICHRTIRSWVMNIDGNKGLSIYLSILSNLI